MGYHVHYAYILVVTYAGYDRQRELRRVRGYAVGVEYRKVAGRAAAAYYHDSVELLFACGDRFERGHDRILGRSALHHRVEQRRMEGIAAAAYLAHEVAVSGGLGARYHGHALHHGRHEGLAVHVPHPVLVQGAYGLLPAPLDIAQRVGGVYVGYLQREAVYFVVYDHNLGQYAYAGRESGPGLRFEVGGKAGVGAAPYHGTRLCARRTLARTLFDEVDIAVPRVVDLYLRYLGTDP